MLPIYVNKDVIDQLKDGDTDLFGAMEQDPKVLNVFDKTFEDIAKVANNKNKAAAKETMEYIKNTGEVGKFLVDKYKDWVEFGAS